jgi:two-component system cell cycle sensor histidine kinase/response regulator CckA
MTGIMETLPTPYEAPLWTRVTKIERRQWWLWASAIVITILLMVGMGSFAYLFERSDPNFSFTIRDSLRGLFALVFLFDVYTIYQQLQIHRIRRRLSDQEQIFRLITENAEDLITVVDHEGNRLYSSPAYQRLGYSRDELLGTPIAKLVHADDEERVLAARSEAFEKGSSPRVEYRFRRKDGDWRILESTISPVRGHRGGIERIVVVSRDITERKEAELLLQQRDEQLRQAQKMEAVGRLSGGIAHDFNNLLGVIIGYSESIEQRLTPGDDLRKSAEEIRKAGERAASLTHQLLSFSRQQALQHKILDLNSLVSDMGEMLRRLIGKHIELTVKLAPHLGQVKAGQSQLEQVIVNLVVNARDAMLEGGKLLIETANLTVSEMLASSLPFLRPGPYVLLTVRDTGAGMDGNTQRHIFEPFFTTKPPGKGTGLGLATVYGVVKQSGGGVTVESVVGKGSTFKIFLPQAQEAADTCVSEPRGACESTGTGTILLAEDEEALLTLIAERLTDSGYTVLTAHDGVQALEVARSFRGPIQLLLTDVVMPRMGGVTLARSISEVRPEIRVLFMSGHAEHGTPGQGPLRLAAESIEKPFSHERLLQKIRQAMDAIPLQLQG